MKEHLNEVLLSKLIPVKFTSTYGTYQSTPEWSTTPDQIETSTWWQWRDRIWSHKQQVVAG